MYTNCPICNNRASKNTINKTGECNECQSKRILNNYNEKNYRLSKIKSHFASDLLIEFIVFIAKSPWKSVLQLRMVTDFVKILSGYTGNEEIVDSHLEVDFYSKSSIKSPTIIFTIKAFLISKNLLILDREINQGNFYPDDIRPEKRFKKDVCDYIFSEKRCNDCGKKLTDKSQHSFCYDCIAFRTIYRRTTFEYIDASFVNSSIKGLYYHFVQYLYGLNRTTQTHAEILGNSEKFFIYLQDYIPNGLKFFPFVIEIDNNENKFRVINGNKFLNIFLSNDWLASFKDEFSQSNNSNEIFLNYLENVGLLKPRIIDEKYLIIQKVKQIDNLFQKPLLKMIEFEHEIIENLKRKNTTKTKKWISVESTFLQIIRFYNWLKKHHSISNWAEVEEDMVNKYLLEFDFQNGQIIKRTLYNLFIYMKKHGYVFTVPIEQFVARDSMIEVEALSLNQHKAILRAIETGDGDLAAERLLSSLVYFHGLTSAQIRSVELENICLEKKIIIIQNRPPAYLRDLDLQLLEKVLKVRDVSLGRKHSNKLFPSFKSLNDVAISNKLINDKVKCITGFSPKRLRIAAFQYCADRFGSQFLYDCFGLSLTQCARYGRVGEELLGVQVKEEIKTNK